MINKLEWDSNFFNLKVGEFIYYQNYKDKDLSAFDLIYVVSDKDFELQLENFENSFAETKVIFNKKPEKGNQNPQPIFSFDKQNIDIQELYYLAFESGKNSRFLLDKKFNPNHFRMLYKQWIDNSINKKFADDVLVYFEEKTAKGFVTYKVIDTTATIGLIAVNPNSQGKGIGAKLVQHLENLAFEKGIKQIMIPTQMNNISACNFYSKQGYAIKSKTYIKHYWKNDTI